ncbi:uncharacterized protein LOC128242595 isoform X2 [Mya arenaria]|uniref:uncharacterized protein LOC128242595 isoform X2 n=1 Tax=Mya arenaria TaxID=6604 RepID=UPI0022E51370|nr:uncharacterized protein LOC128242595 isoform X2 [Mya arenaria]
MYSPHSHVDEDRNWTEADLSLEKASTLVGSIVYLCILMVVGMSDVLMDVSPTGVPGMFHTGVFWNGSVRCPHGCFSYGRPRECSRHVGPGTGVPRKCFRQMYVGMFQKGVFGDVSVRCPHGCFRQVSSWM